MFGDFKFRLIFKGKGARMSLLWLISLETAVTDIYRISLYYLKFKLNTFLNF